MRVTAVPGNLSSAEDAVRIRDRATAAGISVDVLANVAGIGHFGPFAGQPLEQSLDMISVDVIGVVALTRLFVGDVVESGSAGGIINVGSLSGYQPVPYQAVYAAGKAFILSFSHALREELVGSGAHVMVAAPWDHPNLLLAGSRLIRDLCT